MSKRDKFLTAALGMCWHEPITVVGDGYNFYVCKHCGATPVWNPDSFIQPRFSEVKWFIILHEWVVGNPRFSGMFFSDHNPYQYPSISPEIFADCVYEYLIEQEKSNIFAHRGPEKEKPMNQGLIDKIKNMIGVLYEKG